MTGDVSGVGVVTIRVKDPLNAKVNHKIKQQPHLQSSQTTLEWTKNTIICNLTKHQFINIAAGWASGSVLGLHSLRILYLDVMVNDIPQGFKEQSPQEDAGEEVWLSSDAPSSSKV